MSGEDPFDSRSHQSQGCQSFGWEIRPATNGSFQCQLSVLNPSKSRTLASLRIATCNKNHHQYLQKHIGPNTIDISNNRLPIFTSLYTTIVSFLARSRAGLSSQHNTFTLNPIDYAFHYVRPSGNLDEETKMESGLVVTDYATPRRDYPWCCGTIWWSPHVLLASPSTSMLLCDCQVLAWSQIDRASFLLLIIMKSSIASMVCIMNVIPLFWRF